MKAAPVARRFGTFIDALYREMVHLEGLADRAEALSDQCNDIDLPDVVDKAFRTRLVNKAGGAMTSVSFQLRELHDTLQEIALAVDEATAELEDAGR